MRGDTTEREERIRALAYRMWEHDGRPTGQDDYYWQKAEDRINAEDAADAAERRIPRRL